MGLFDKNALAGLGVTLGTDTREKIFGFLKYSTALVNSFEGNSFPASLSSHHLSAAETHLPRLLHIPTFS